MNCTTRCIIPLLVVVCINAIVAAETEIYDFSDGAPRAGDFEVFVDGEPVFVYDTAVAAIATFGVEGKATIRIQREQPFHEVVVRPINAAVESTVEGEAVEFTLSRPVQLSIEFDGDIRRPLYVFANPLQQPPKPSDHVKVFAGGKIHQVGQIDLTSGQSIYLAGGAIVQGYVRATDAEDIRIMGPGILDASYRREKKTTSVLLSGCRNIDIRDLLLTDSFGWTVHLSQCSDVTISNMKQVGWRANSDGIDIEASHRVRVSDSFLRNADDCIAIKSKPRGDGRGITTEDILVERTTLWNSLPGNAMEIGFELRADAVRQVVFRDCDIIRVERGAAFSIHNGDNALVEDVSFEGIRVEDVRGDFADMYIGLSIYSGDCPNPYRRSDPQRKRIPLELQDPISGDNRGQWILPPDRSEYAAQRGQIRNIRFRGIHFLCSDENQLPPSLFIGYDNDHAISDVVFRDIFIRDKQITKWPEGSITTRNAHNVRFVE